MDVRKVELRELGEHAFQYRQIIDVVLSRPLNPQAGMTLPEIRRCNKILDKVEAATDAVLLTPEEWQFLKDRVEAFPFGIGGRLIQQFGDDVANAPLVPVEPSKS